MERLQDTLVHPIRELGLQPPLLASRGGKHPVERLLDHLLRLAPADILHHYKLSLCLLLRPQPGASAVIYVASNLAPVHLHPADDGPIPASA